MMGSFNNARIPRGKKDSNKPEGSNNKTTRQLRSSQSKVPRPTESLGSDSESEEEPEEPEEDEIEDVLNEPSAKPVKTNGIKRPKFVRFDEKEVPRELPKSVPSSELPFRGVPELQYVERGNVPAKAKQPSVIVDLTPPATEVKAGRTPAYRNRAPIEMGGKALDITAKFLEAPFTMTGEDLLRLSPAVREEVKRLISKKRRPSEQVSMVEIPDEGDEPVRSEEVSSGEIKQSFHVSLTSDAIDIDSLPPVSCFMLADGVETYRDSNGKEQVIPEGSLIAKDPYMQYLSNLSPGETPKQVYVAKDSQSLRSLHPLVNGRKMIESLADSGSQIISASAKIAEMTSMSWNPDVIIHMQSANKQTERTLGLAKNVPFLFGDITVYLQLHIIRDPAYDILLGRPFDVLTESVVKNTADGGQTITITDPNTGKRCTLPTFARGTPPQLLRRINPPVQSGFHNSMI